MEILSQKLNPLFGRNEVEIMINSAKTTSESEIEKIIADKFSSNVENVKIRQIKGKFGRNEFLIKADIYQTPELKQKFGVIKKRNRRKKKGAAK